MGTSQRTVQTVESKERPFGRGLLGEAPTGLLDASQALSQALTLGASSPTAVAAPASTQAEGLPSDEVILKWATDVREAYKVGHLSLEGIKYWVRYTFPSHGTEYKAVGQTLDRLVRQGKLQ
jgi:hypothetical protein